MIIFGQKIAQEIIKDLKNKETPKKILAIILVGNNLESLNFLKQKEKIAKELRVDFRVYKFLKEIKNDALRKEVGKIALLKRVGGVIVQLPLPSHLNKHYILNVIPREKDIDVLGERALGAFYTGRNPVLPPAVGVVEKILNSKSLNFKKVAVVGAGFLIGKPIIIWLINNIAELTIFNKGSDLLELKNFDLIIAGVGQAGIITPEMLKNDVGVIDFGYSQKEKRGKKKEEGKFMGDFDISKSREVENLNWYTPTPGGTGPILIAKIFENFYKLNI